MELKVEVFSVFNCSLQRAFKTPLLCDISKVHTGFLFMPRITHCIDDENWGQIGSSKKVIAAKSLTQKGGFISVDRIIDRVENSYWKFQVDSFQSWMLGFHKFVGEWRTTEIRPDVILIQYTYTLYSNNIMLYPLNWLFARFFWKIYMKRIIKNVKLMAYNNEPYMYS